LGVARVGGKNPAVCDGMNIGLISKGETAQHGSRKARGFNELALPLTEPRQKADPKRGFRPLAPKEIDWDKSGVGRGRKKRGPHQTEGEPRGRQGA